MSWGTIDHTISEMPGHCTLKPLSLMGRAGKPRALCTLGMRQTRPGSRFYVLGEILEGGSETRNRTQNKTSKTKGWQQQKLSIL